MYPEICYPTFFLLHTGEVFRRAYFALDFGCSEVADSKTWFSPNSGDLSKNKLNYTTFSYLLIATSGQTVSKKFLDCGREISILLSIYRHLLF